MPVNLQHLQHALNATKTEKERFQLSCAVSVIQNNYNPTRNSESARRNAPDSVHGGEIRDIKCKTVQPNEQGKTDQRSYCFCARARTWMHATKYWGLRFAKSVRTSSGTVATPLLTVALQV